MAREVKVAILGDSSSFDRAFGQAESTMSRFGRSVGQTVAVVGTVAAAIGVGLTTSLVKVGVEYNTLEQRSRSAFKSIMGDAELATKMMDDLMAFAKTSPFPRQAFIQATQQMLAFGIEADKVIPYLSAIQDSTAAIGGSDVELLELANIFSKIKSTAKITAENLNEFGYRGVNAAEIIGSMMGKTASVIRDEISDGALDAQTALDALAFGITLKFGGAAAGLKETWVGAVDRVKGAWRDLGSALVEPFISKQGGGAAVKWANDLADLLRKIEKDVVPKLSAAFTRFVERITPGIDRAFEVLQSINFDAILSGISEMKTLIVGVTTGLTVMGVQAIPVIGGLFGAFNPFATALAASLLTIPEFRDGLINAISAVVAAFQENGLAGAWQAVIDEWNAAWAEGGFLNQLVNDIQVRLDEASAIIAEWGPKVLADFRQWWNDTGQFQVGEIVGNLFSNGVRLGMAQVTNSISDPAFWKDWFNRTFFGPLYNVFFEETPRLVQGVLDWFADQFNRIRDGFRDIGARAGRAFLDGLGGMFDGLSGPLGDVVGGFLPEFATGGVVPGPYPGARVPILAHAGETVVSKRNGGFADTGGSNKPMVLNDTIVVTLDGRELGRAQRRRELALR